MTEQADDTSPGNRDLSVEEHLRLAREAKDRGDLTAAMDQIATCKTEHPDRVPLPMRFLEIDLLAETDRAAAAEAAMGALCNAHPRNARIRFKQAQVLRDLGKTDAAWTALDAALDGDPDCKVPALHMLHADMLVEAGRAEAAEHALDRLRQAQPTSPSIPRRLAQMAAKRKDFVRAAAYLDAAIAQSPEQPMLSLRKAQYLAEAGQMDAAVETLTEARTRHGAVARLWLAEIDIRRRAGQVAAADALLKDAVVAAPSDIPLLDHLFSTQGGALQPDQADEILALLRPRMSEEDVERLSLRAELAMMRFDRALERLRIPPRAGRSEMEVAQLIEALIGTRRLWLAFRYLQFCLRRWPQSARLLASFVKIALKLGRLDAIATYLDSVVDLHDAHVIVGHRLALAAYRNDFETAAAAFDSLVQSGHAGIAHMNMFAALMFAQLDLSDRAQSSQVLHDISEKLFSLPHRRSTRAGQLLTELGLEVKFLSRRPPYSSESDWVRDHPKSTVAAIRLIGAWHNEQTPGPGGETIPPLIYQYWDRPEPPPALQPFLDSWAAVPGFAYQRLDQAAAAKFLRTEYGPRWVTAFRLARNPAHAADLLRMCLLAKTGGIWADADDALIGRLDRLLGAGRGLILYREPPGGMVANNFIAASPGHPVIRAAASQACISLLQRGAETPWSATGPGLLTRVVAQHLLPDAEGATVLDLTLLNWPQIAAHVLMYAPLAYKRAPEYWNADVQRPDSLWDMLHQALRVEQVTP